MIYISKRVPILKGLKNMSISRTGWIKNGIYKGQTLVQWEGSCSATLDPLLKVMHAEFQIFYLDKNVSNRKRCHISKRLFQNINKIAKY